VSAVRRPALRVAQHRALGRKVSDEFTVPQCAGAIIATPIDAATKPHGGKMLMLTRP
jgi:hypothetical protein